MTPAAEKTASGLLRDQKVAIHEHLIFGIAPLHKVSVTAASIFGVIGLVGAVVEGKSPPLGPWSSRELSQGPSPQKQFLGI